MLTGQQQLMDPESMQSLENECRLCFDAGDASQQLIAPCQCSGTTKWVHRCCLNQWRHHGQATNAKAMSHCPTCAYEYKLYATFDVHETRRRKRKRIRRLMRDSIFAFVGSQAVILVVALILRQFDDKQVINQIFHSFNQHKWNIQHWASGFFSLDLLHYYSAAVVLICATVGVATLCYGLLSCCFPERFPWGARERRIRYGRQETCVDDCCYSCTCYDPVPVNDTCCCWACPCDTTGGVGLDCTCGSCEGEFIVVVLLVLLVILVFVGLFVVMFLISIWIQRGGQRYLRNMHLRDIAERFAVVDHMSETDIARADRSEMDQATLKSMMQSEINTTRSIVRVHGNPVDQDQLGHQGAQAELGADGAEGNG